MAADGCVLNILVGRDIAVDEDTRFLAGIVPDHDGLDEAVGILDLRRSAFHGDEAAEIAFVLKVCGRDLLRLDRRFLAALFNAGHLDLAFALIGGRCAGDADLVADLELARDRERVDACGLVLDIDAVEERGILVVAGGVGGHDALDGVLDALFFLCLNRRDLGDHGTVKHGQEVFADAVVGVVLLCRVVDLRLHLEVRHEGCAGDDDHALALKLLRRHDHQAVVAFREGVLRGSCAAAAVFVNVHGVGRCMAVDDRADRCGQRGGRVAVCAYCVDGRAAVVAEALGVELVIRMSRVVDHTVQKRVLHVVIREVESPLVNAVGCGANVVIRRVVGDAEAGAERGQNVVLRLSHVLDAGVLLNDIVVLIVVGPAGEDHHAAIAVERRDGGQLFCGIGLRVGLRSCQTAGRGRQDERDILGIRASLDELFAGVQLHRAHGILRGEGAEVAHGILVVAVHVFVVVRSVDADVDELACVEHVELNILGERVFLAVLLDHGCDRNGHHAGLVRGVLEVYAQRAACSQRVAGGVRAERRAAGGVGDGLDGSCLRLAVEERGGDGQLFIGDRGSRAALGAGDAELERFADPHRSRHGQIAVALGDADEVVAVVGSKLHADLALGEIGSILPAVGDDAGVCNQLDLLDRVAAVRITERHVEAQLLRLFRDGGAEHHAVDGVADFEVLVLGGVHAHVTDGGVDALFAEIIGQDDVAGIVGVAPAALVVILVVGRGEVPALVQSLDVFAVARIVAACADLAFAVADFDHVHTAVNDGVPIGEVLERAERGAGVVELADGVDALVLRQQRVIGFHARIVRLVVERRVVAGDDAGGIEGVDMAGTAGPRHFKARDGDHFTRVFLVEFRNRVLVGLPAVAGIGILDKGRVVQSRFDVGVILAVEVVGMVGERDEVDIRVFRQTGDIVQCAVQRAGAVGILRVGVQLPEVQLVLRRADDEGPSRFRRLAVRGARDRYGNGGSAVRKILGRGIDDLAVFVDRVDRLVVDRHRYAGVLASVHDIRGYRRPLVGPGLRACRRLHVGDHGLVLDGDHSDTLKLRALLVLTGDGHGELFAGDLVGRNGDGIAVLRRINGQLFRAQLCAQRFNAEYRVNGEVQRVRLSDIRIGNHAEVDCGHIDNAVRHSHAVRHGIEEEGVDGVIRGFVHAVGLEAVAVILQVLAVSAIELCRAALHLIAAHAAGAGTDRPVRVVGSLKAVERVVASAVGAEVAVGLVVEAEVALVLLHLKDDCAVCRSGLAGLDGGRSLVDCRAIRVIVLLRQNRLCVLVVNHDLVADRGQIANRRRYRLGRDELHGVDAFVCGLVEVCAELFKALAGICVPFHIIRVAAAALAGRVDDVEATLCCGLCDRPGVIGLVERQAVLFIVHGQLAAVCGRDGINAVRGADVPDEVSRRIFHLAVRNGDSLTGAVIRARCFCGHRLAAARIVDHILSIRNERLLDRNELHGVDAFVCGLVEVCAELFKALAGICIPFYIIRVAAATLAGRVDDVVAALCCGLCDRPGVIGLVQRQTVLFIVHGQLIAVLGRDGVDAVFRTDRPDQIRSRVCYLSVFNRDVLACAVIRSGRVCGHCLAAARIVNDVFAVLEHRNRSIGLDGIGELYFVAGGHAVLRGLDSEGDVFIHGRLGTLVKGRAVRRNEDRRTLSRAGEGDRRTLVYFALRQGSRRGRDLLGRFGTADNFLFLRQLVELEGVDIRLAVVHAEAGKVAAEILQILSFSVILGIRTGNKAAVLRILQLEQVVFLICVIQLDIRAVQIEILIARFKRIVFVSVDSNRQQRCVLRLRGQNIVRNRRISSDQFDLALARLAVRIGIAFGRHDLAAALRRIDQDLILGRNRVSLDVLVDQFIDRDGELQFITGVFVVHLGPDGIRPALRSLDWVRVCLLLRAASEGVVDRRARGRAGELDLRADLDLIAVFYVRGRGSDLLLGFADSVDARQKHGFVRTRRIVQEPRRVGIIQNASAARVCTRNRCVSVGIDGNRPGARAAACVVQHFGFSC